MSKSKPIIAREFIKKTFVQTGAKKTLDGWAAYFTIGNQSFTLLDVESKQNAEWYEKMVKKALVNLVTDYANHIGIGANEIKKIEKYFRTRKRQSV